MGYWDTVNRGFLFFIDILTLVWVVIMFILIAPLTVFFYLLGLTEKVVMGDE